MAGNKSLHAANRAKQDEFYTQLPDIEKELKHYRKHFRGKTVYCNCDDPTISNFFRYFRLNFAKLGLKRLIATCYKNQQSDLFSKHDMETAAGLEYVGNETEPTVFQLKENGDFRNRECIELLKQADIVVTNPPFSLFREYIAQLVEYGKKFVVIGSMNAITYKEVFPLIKSGRLWLGHGPAGKDMLFDVPEDYATELVRNKKEGSAYRLVDGVIKGRLGNAVWFTNLNHKKRNEELILFKRYSPEEYLKYDNYDAINVNKTADIPVDYAGEMGVPITFLDKHNPEQFEIIGMDRPLITQLTGKQSRFKIKGKEIYARIVIRNKRIRQ
ncbi:MAG: adenine-specific methyltransferase EcoRI family protein [Candidatus Poribacteria bacterium]|nr:adenine-specific methyltransferase EcoRI family protein [Candidatus Poribacteria bacterium]